ncbi:MAG: baseplate J/gp47 family protein [Planctomycetes bacterium]|jgi:uncharacterized phage protein gp47/JayE|nr:baseplate J/gp47 family protein [Planctomycetota bacterium]
MGQLQIKRYKQILERMRNRVVARTDLTDLVETSSVNQVLAAAAREDDDQWYAMGKVLDIYDIDNAVGPDLDAEAKKLNPALISRNPAKKATGAVVFGRTGTIGAIGIPQGTQVQVPATAGTAALKFVTTAEGQIADGASVSGSIQITASEPGTAYNVAPETIRAFVSKPSGVDTVSNPAQLTNGDDIEKDDSFRTRIKLFAKSLSRATNLALTYAALTAEDTVSGKSVAFASVVEDEVHPGNVIIYIDDGSGTAESVASVVDEVVVSSAVGGEVDLYGRKPIKIENTFVLKKNTVPLVLNTDYTINPASGHIKLATGLSTGDTVTETCTYFTGLIAECQKIIDGDPADRINYPGYRSAGVLVRVLVPTIIQMAFDANITVRSGYSQTDVATQVASAISGYINALGIGDDVIWQELGKRAMAVPGMYDIGITDPTRNRVVLDNQLARILSSAITIS